MKILSIIFLALFMNAIDKRPDLDSIAERYVRLVLAAGVHDEDYVDAYYGPKEWKEEAQKQKLPLTEIRDRAESVLKELSSLKMPAQEMERLRYEYLKKQLESLHAFADLRLGKKYSFDQESKALYDAVSPHFPEEHFATALQSLDALLPGKGTIQERYDALRKDFIIPPGNVDKVFQLALEESRKRTRKYIELPPEENFTVEYLTNKPWGGYNWYQGNFRSLIQVNTDLPIYIDRAIDLAGHEGYPGHHVYNVLLEQELLRKRKWLEFSVYPLFSPQSLIAEGSANYGVEALFPEGERLEFERKVLFPAAGLDPARAAEYHKVAEQIEKLAYAGNVAAKEFLDGHWTEDQVIEWSMKYSLYTKERAVQRLQFIKKYRSYVINYNLGEDLVTKYIEAQSLTQEERWKAFTKLLGSPRLPSGLAL
ncbi:hypothetical protein L0156_24265 [bacterium]|nr:hypothetical protein [bacterium]